MYQKYNTDAIVLGGRERGDADKVFALYTRDFGLVYARASAVRAEKSKMRYALQSYAHARVSLVRGSRGWRAAGASCHVAGLEGKGLVAFARIAALVSRLVAGEERNEYLFDTLAQAHASLIAASDETIPTIELVCAARILYALGYLSAEAIDSAILTHTAYGFEHIREAHSLRDSLLASVNRALSETHL